MIIIPAIDLLDHQVVRLSQGKVEEAKIYSDDPAAIAQKWVDQGAKRIHIVDLNGALEGCPVHFKDIESIAKSFPKVEIEVGGGLRDMATVDRYFSQGVGFCVLGTAAVKDPAFIRSACRKYPEKIILGLDAKEGQVAVEGWGEVTEVVAWGLALRFKNEKIREIIYTDVARDGMMRGINLDGVKKMAKGSPFPVIASGGVNSLDDIRSLSPIPNVSGVIVGKALYEGTVDLREAIDVAT